MCLNPQRVLPGAFARIRLSIFGIPIMIPMPLHHFYSASFSDIYYLEASKPPNLELYQMEAGKKVKFGLKAQLENLLGIFVSKTWPYLSGTKIESVEVLDPTPFHMYFPIPCLT